MGGLGGTRPDGTDQVCQALLRSVVLAQAIDEAGRRRVEVQEPDRVGIGIAEAVDAVGRSGEERARTGHTRLVADPELDLALERVEGVDVVGMAVRVDALEGGLKRHVDDGELREVAEDPVRPYLTVKGLGGLGGGEHGIRERTSSVSWDVVLVEMGALAPNVVAEAARRNVEVEEHRRRLARIPKGVRAAGRRPREAARCHENRLERGAERDLDLAVEHVEGIGVEEVDVWLRPLLAGRVSKPRDDDLLEVDQDPEGLLPPVDGDLAFSRR